MLSSRCLTIVKLYKSFEGLGECFRIEICLSLESIRDMEKNIFFSLWLSCTTHFADPQEITVSQK